VSSGSGLSGPVGSLGSGVTAATIFSELLIAWTTVADAAVAPSSTPSVGTILWQRDGTRSFQWQYHGTDGWKGVEVA
jgi:hypothetical protein